MLGGTHSGPLVLPQLHPFSQVKSPRGGLGGGHPEHMPPLYHTLDTQDPRVAGRNAFRELTILACTYGPPQEVAWAAVSGGLGQSLEVRTMLSP